MKKYNLFLDDDRNVEDVTWGNTKFFESKHRWVVVRTAAQFVATLISEGIPSRISFDNDIKDFTGHNGSEITGYDIAKSLVNYCIDNSIRLPKVQAHSMNVVDQPKIEAYFANALFHHPHLAE